LPLAVELRNAGLAVVDFLRQVVTLAGVALLVALGAALTPFFAVQIVVGLAVLAVTPLLVGIGGLVRPRFDRDDQRTLFKRALPIAVALALGQIYFRLVIILMSLISSPQQTGYFGGSLRAMEAMIVIPYLVAGVALPMLTAAARDDLTRLRYAVGGLGEGAVLGGVLAVLVVIPIAQPLMELIGGEAFGPSGDVLRIQVAALMFIALNQIWTVSLIALGQQRQLILANGLGLVGLGVFAGILVPAYDANGGAVASVLGDALLAGLIYWRLQRHSGRVMVGAPFLARVAVAAALACIPLVLGPPAIVAALLAAAVFVGTGWVIGMVPVELRDQVTALGRLRGGRGAGPA
jgi:O-antigen/teichoic acid export membrane protein